MKRTTILVCCVAAASSAPVICACKAEKPPAPVSTGKSAGIPKSDHTDSAAGHGGAVIQLGTATIGTFNVKATRDEGQIVAGKDAPIDVTVTPAVGAAAKATAVRFWIGTEDAKGSVKAKAEIEDPNEPNRWHTHAEIPSAIPAGSKLWVEIEDDKGGKSVGSFDLRI